MNALVPIDSKNLDLVTGGRSSSRSSNIDSLLGTLNSLTSTINDIKKKTSGLGQTEMLMLCFLAMQRSRGVDFVYASRPPGCRW